jgi:hypothetical protein
MKKARKPKNASVVVPSFEEVATLISPNNTPPWLPTFLEWWAQGIAYDRLVDLARPSKVGTAKILDEITDALALVRRNLENPSIRDLITRTTTLSPSVDKLVAAVDDLSRRVGRVRSSPLLVGRDGKTKRGRGKPRVENVFDAKTMCAARILELCRFLNKFEPGARSTQAAKAAEAYWIASGGTSRGTKDLVSGWKRHFKAARDNAGAVGLKRLIWLRDIEQCAQRGRPPWFLGRTFPPPQAG